MRLAAIISINLAIINLFPIPALDGGRLLFLAIEGIRRKPIPQEWEQRANLIGFSLLILLMVVITYFDISRIISGGSILP
jgi:regulator of sigma E protease